MKQTCFKCGHEHEVDQILPNTACPACGAIYAKVEMARAQANLSPDHIRTAISPPPGIDGSRVTTGLTGALLAGCFVLTISTASLTALYYQEVRLNRILMSQRDLKPDQPLPNPGPAIAASASNDLRTTTPSTMLPANLAENAEVIVVSGYEAGNQATNGTAIRVIVDRPGKSVLLVLSSYEKIAWSVDATSGTQIKGIVVSGYVQPDARVVATAPVFQSKLPYSYEKNSGNFLALLSGLNRLFGISRIDAFRGQYALPGIITIDKTDPGQSDLTLQGELPQKPLTPLGFELTNSDYRKVPWSLEGPTDAAPQIILAPSKTVKALQDQLVYQVVGNDLFTVDQSTGKRIKLDLPDNFPSFSWPMDVAYDSKRHYVTLASLGGEGFLYRYDTNTGKWLDFRSLNNVDINTLAYDEVADRYVAWTTDGSLFFATPDGTPLFTRRLSKRLQNFNRLYDTGNARPPALMLVPKGEQIALIKPENRSVGYIWYYDVKLDLVQLTYKQIK